MSHFIHKSLSMSLEFLFPTSVFYSSNLLLKKEINLTSIKKIHFESTEGYALQENCQKNQLLARKSWA
jgi:hypothetical protein